PGATDENISAAAIGTHLEVQVHYVTPSPASRSVRKLDVFVQGGAVEVVIGWIGVAASHEPGVDYHSIRITRLFRGTSDIGILTGPQKTGRPKMVESAKSKERIRCVRAGSASRRSSTSSGRPMSARRPSANSAVTTESP